MKYKMLPLFLLFCIPLQFACINSSREDRTWERPDSEYGDHLLINPKPFYNSESYRQASRSSTPNEETAKYLRNEVKFQTEGLEGNGATTYIHENKSDPHHSSDSHSTIHVASWQWDYVRTPLIYTVVVIAAGFCKIGFHHAGFLSSIFPESCMLIVLGIAVGAIVHYTQSRELLPQFTPKAFFLFLLPPIVLESAYSLHDRAFFSNLGTIILYAVVGTLINCFSIGLTLYATSELGLLSPMKLPLIECLVFSSLISAVDPVAVLAIFQEVGVNKSLYFLVFGESLLNDAVTIVLYMMMVSFSKAEFITAEQISIGVAAFICVSLGGLAIGIIMGVITAIITKHTKEVRVVEPLAMLGVAYLSYLLAEMVHFSGIISIIGCGIVQAHYASNNISQKSKTTVKYFTKMVSAVCDTVIFLFLGMVLVDDAHQWHTGFVLCCTVLCFVYRFMGVFFLTYCANKLERARQINAEEQFIMAYGGLRGAVAFSLVIMLDDADQNKQLFITATLFIILFTVFIQGATIKPLVVFLKIRRQTAKNDSMFTEVNKKLLDHVMAGVEEVTGDHGGNYWKQLLFHYNTKYLKKWLQCNSSESSLSRVYTRMMLEDHFAHLYGPATAIEDKKPLLLNRVSVDQQEDMLDVLDPGGRGDASESGEEEGVCGFKIDHQNSHRRDIQIRDMSNDEKEMEMNKPLRGAHQVTERRRSSTGSSGAARPPSMKRMTTVISGFRKSEDEDPSRLLQKALLNNPYNKLHHKYNPNLVGDEDQDMEAHLRLRRMRAKRLTLLAMHKPQPETSKNKPAGEEADIAQSPAVVTAASFFLERAHKRRTLKKEAEKSQKPTSVPSKSPKLERQNNISAEIKEVSENDLKKVSEESESSTCPTTVVSISSNRNSQSVETNV